MSKWSIITTVLLYLSLTPTIQACYEGNIIHDTTNNWSWVVPLGKYDYCDIMPVNGLIKVGIKIGEKSLGNAGPVLATLVYGLLDRDGNPLTEIVFDEIGYPNSDGYMLATLNKDDGQIRSVVINHVGQILPTPDDAVVTLFDRSYSVETTEEFIHYVNNKSYSVLKSSLKSEIDVKNPMTVCGVYSSCFLLLSNEYLYVFNFDGSLRYKTDLYFDDSPQGLFVSNGRGEVGFVDFDGNVLIPATYRELRQSNLVPGIFTYSVGSFDSNDQAIINHYRILDINDPNALIGLEYSEGIYFDDYGNEALLYLTAYKPDEGYLRGVYSFDGEEILPLEYEEIGRLRDGLIRFERGRYTGYADLNGNVLFEKERYRFEGLSPSADDLKYVH